MLAFTILHMTVGFRTKRLLLRPLQLSDDEHTQRLFPQWEIVKFLNSKVPWPYPARIECLMSIETRSYQGSNAEKNGTGLFD
jgi:hypothetical protein